LLRSTIHKLLAYLPHDRTRLLRFRAQPHELEKLEDHNFVFSELTYAYGCMDFGWLYANEVVRAGIQFPPILSGKDSWIWRAYWHLKTKRTDPEIEEAMQLAGVVHSKHKTTKTTIDSLLISKHGNCKMVAKALSIPEGVVKAYEALFFDVLDRKKDQAAMINLIYPEGRFVEMQENYADVVSVRNLMMRAGFNHGADYVKYFSGLNDDLLGSFAAGQAATQFESQVMALGLILADAGMINSARHNRGIAYSKQMVQAAKQGGQDPDKLDIFENIGRRLRDDLVSHLQPQADERARFFSGLKKAHPDSASIIDADVST
jgi:hypothetical protein